MIKTICRALAFSAAVLVAGCSYTIPYHESAQFFSVDPTSGHLLRTTLWKNSEGPDVTTVDDLTANGIEVRREPQPSTGLLHLGFL
jgi:hypothetical protein